MDTNYVTQGQISGDDIRSLRSILKLDRKELAALAGVSPRTVEHWENGTDRVGGPIVFLRRMLLERPLLAEELKIPPQEYSLRLLYYYRNDLCTLIDVDESRQLVKIRNYTERLQYRAFGPMEHPGFLDVENFLKSRCFPETRDKLKLELKELGLPYYDPLLIVEKTGGKMAEDEFRIEVIRK